MEKKHLSSRSSSSFIRHLLAMALGSFLALVPGGSALAQQVTVSGTVSSVTGGPLRGVTVRVAGTDTRAITDANGRYTIQAPSDAVLSFSSLGRRPVQQGVLGRTTLDISMDAVAYLEEVTVTGYSEQRRADVTGAIGSVNIETANRMTTSSVLQKLDATVTGVTVSTSGSPGGRSTVRVRGVSSFQNNDPLYIVDGTPVSESYINWLNPNDITSVQVLKDASSASIYGSRASNGVIVIETTKKGMLGAPQATLRVRTGMASPVKGYDDMLMTSSLKYAEVVRQAYVNAGQPVPTNIFGDPNSPTVPDYMYAHPSTFTATDAFGRPTNVNLSAYSYPNVLVMRGSAGTNWWDAVFSPAMVGDYNLEINGGGDDNLYSVSFNYFDQMGTAAYNEFKRGSVRVNTQFNRGKLSFGENIALATDRSVGGMANDPGGYAEDGILGKNILMQPVVPIYDVQGNFASGKAVGTGNQSNPLKFAYAAKDNINRNNRVFGNLFAGFDLNPQIRFKSRLGFNLFQGAITGFNQITPENSEPSLTNSMFENHNQYRDWTLSNTVQADRKFFTDHSVSVLVGQEAFESNNRFLTAGMSNLLNEGVSSRYLQDALGDASTKTVSSTGGRSALLSFFGKADYNFKEKYVASFTLRKDGSSNLSPDNRWGTFPAVGLGWRMSKEGFLQGNKIFSDVMLRYGWGVTGNQQIPSGRIVAQFGGSRGDTYYDVGGSNNIVAGFRQTSLGNPNLKWEENISTNFGADLALFDNRLNVVLDVYQRKTNNLLFDPPIPGTAGIAAPPIVNIGKMQNTGFDFSVGHSNATWSATFNGSHYKNKIVSIDGVQQFFFGPISTRFGNQVINQVGQPIGAFYGLIAEGMFRDAADVAAHPAQDGKAPGRIKFRDVNGDGSVTSADRTIIGSPHPDFTGGLDLSYRRKAWDVSATIFGSFGNEIFDVQKEFYVFRNFSTNVMDDLIENSWRPDNLDAKYPRLDQNDAFSRQLSSFYVEDGSYVRVRSLQLGYNVPQSMVSWLGATRVYVQGENLFTITGYPGLDPSLPAANITGPAGDIRDQYRGIDRGAYPSNRTFSVGFVTSF